MEIVYLLSPWMHAHGIVGKAKWVHLSSSPHSKPFSPYPTIQYVILRTNFHMKRQNETEHKAYHSSKESLLNFLDRRECELAIRLVVKANSMSLRMPYILNLLTHSTWHNYCECDRYTNLDFPACYVECEAVPSRWNSAGREPHYYSHSEQFITITKTNIHMICNMCNQLIIL